MSEKLLVPDIGEFEKVEVIELLVKVGEQINIDDPIVTIESDKSSVEIPTIISGTVESVNVKVGDKVSKGDLLLNVSSLKKNSSEKIIPQDTENIIKEAEVVLENKRGKIIQQESLKKKNKQLFKLIMKMTLTLWKPKIGLNPYPQLLKKMVIKGLIF